jgi:hypothetical protein
MADLPKYKPDGVTQTRVSRLTGWLAIGATGAITGQSGVSTSTSGGQLCGVTWSRNATGDYRATLHRGYKRAIRGDAQIIGPTIGTAPTGCVDASLIIPPGCFIGSTPVAATGQVGITTMSAAGALADPQSGSIVSYDIELADI